MSIKTKISDEDIAEVAEKTAQISYLMKGNVEYLDGKVGDIEEIILANNDQKATENANLKIEDFAERGYLIGAKKITYKLIFFPENRLVYTYGN